MTAWAVFWIGTGFEVVGLAVAAVGFRSTWREFSPGDRFFQKDVERFKRAGGAVRSFVRRVLRLEQDLAVPTISATGTIWAPALTLRGVGYVGLPSLADDPEGFAAEVEARLGKLHGEVHALRDQLESEAKAREAAEQQLVRDLAAKVANVESLSRRIAVGGLRAQVFGWLSVALGFAFQATATPFM